MLVGVVLLASLVRRSDVANVSPDQPQWDRWHDERRIPFVRLVVPLLILVALALPAGLLARRDEESPAAGAAAAAAGGDDDAGAAPARRDADARSRAAAALARGRAALAGPADRRTPAAADRRRVRDLGPDPQAGRQPPVASLGHRPPAAHAAATCWPATRAGIRTRRRCWSATCHARTAATSGRASAASATPRTRTGSTPTSTTRGSTGDCAGRATRRRSTAPRRRSWSTRFVVQDAQYVFVGPSLGLRGPRRIVQVLTHHDDHLHVRLRASR